MDQTLGVSQDELEPQNVSDALTLPTSKTFEPGLAPGFLLPDWQGFNQNFAYLAKTC
ncbi:hypothetical protein D9M68_949450 [compost metagenome]